MSISLRNYGYSTKKECNERMDAIKCAVIEYGIQPVYERLVKLGKFNPVMKEDAESVAQIYELNEEEGVVVEASVEAEAEKEPTWKALRPEGDKGVKLQQSCKDAPKMVTELGDYGVQDNAHGRMQLLLDLADKHGIFAVLSMMATHIVTLTNADQSQIMAGDMSALTEAYNEKMKAEAEASVEASVEAEGKVLFLEMLDTKLARYKRQLSNLLDSEDLDNNCSFWFKCLRENMVSAYNEKIMKNKKIMEQKVEEFSKIAKIFDKYRDKVVEITKSSEYNEYTMLNNMLSEMSKEEEPVLQDILCSIVSVLKEHKQCDIVSLSELKKRQQFVFQETRKLLNDINEFVKKKSVAITECDIESYDMLVTIIVSIYKQVIPLYVDAQVYDIRIRDITSSLREIPSDMF